MNVTLDSIRQAAEKKYGSLSIDVDEDTTVVLLNPLRMPKAKRDKLMEVQEKLGGEGDLDHETLMRDALRLVADDKDAVNKLLKEIGDDLAVLAQVFESYVERTQPGEASASQG